MAHLTIFSMKPSAGLLHMARLVVTEGFVDDLLQVWSARVSKRIRESLENLETYPELWSTLLPVRMRKTYGESVRRLTVAPFDLIGARTACMSMHWFPAGECARRIERL